MDTQLLNRAKIEFADSIPNEFAQYLAKSTSETAMQLRAEALAFYFSQNAGMPILSPNIEFPKSPTLFGEYSPGMTWQEKLLFIAKYRGTPTTTVEFTDFIMEREPTLDRARVSVAVSVTLNRLKGKKFIQLPNIGRGFSYDIKEGNSINTKPLPPQSKLSDKGYNPTWQ